MSESEKSGRDTARDQSNQEEAKGVRHGISDCDYFSLYGRWNTNG